MGVKVYRLPDEVPAPQPDYMNYNQEKEAAAEAAHQKALKAYYEARGYTGNNTGKIYQVGVADGYAQYMIFEAPRGSNLREKFFLIHLPYGDAYQSRDVGFLTKTEILKRIKSNEEFMKLFDRK
jgi:hypothetical protein